MTALEDTHSSLSSLDSDLVVAALMMMGLWELSGVGEAAEEVVAVVVMAVVCLEEELRVEVVGVRPVVALLLLDAGQVFSVVCSVLALVFEPSSSVGHPIPLILPTISVLLLRSMLLSRLRSNRKWSPINPRSGCLVDQADGQVQARQGRKRMGMKMWHRRGRGE